MSRIRAIASAIWTRLLIIGFGLAAIVRVIGYGLASLIGTSGTIGSRLIGRLSSSDGLRVGSDFARAFLPTLVIQRKIVASYVNSGSTFVTRFDDVKDVLRRDDDFEVVYGPRMREITGGENFFLGMGDSPAYTRDVSNMRLAVRRDDVPHLVKPFVVQKAGEIVRAANGRIDVPRDLTLRVPAQLLGPWFGTPGPSEAEMIAWTTQMFWYLFIDLAADQDLQTRVLDSAKQCRAYLDATIQQRKAHPTETDDVLNRCLAMQHAGLPGMDDLGIRNNLIGLIIGAVPTISKAAVQALDQLLQRPAALTSAQNAARADDDVLLGAHIFEALRFNPVNPAIYRRATRDTVIAAKTPRAIDVPRGSMVFAVNLSAMFDRLKLEAPEKFRVDRPWDNYILWGDGMHACFGAHVNHAIIPAILKPLLAQKDLRRVAGDLGQIETEGTPFPVHMWLEFQSG